MPSTRSFWETCTNCGLTPTHELILTSKPRGRREGGRRTEWQRGNCVAKHDLWGLVSLSREKFRICPELTQCCVQCFLIPDYPWSGACVLDKYETRGECYVKPHSAPWEVWIESENQNQDLRVAWMLWAMLKAITGQYSSYPAITIQRFADHPTALSPQIFRYQL